MYKTLIYFIYCFGVIFTATMKYKRLHVGEPVKRFWHQALTTTDLFLPSAHSVV